VYDLNTPVNSDLLNLSGLFLKGSGTAHNILVNYSGQEGPHTFTLVTQAATNFNAADINVLTGTSGLLLTHALTVNLNSVRLEVTAEPPPVVCPAALENPATPTSADFLVCSSTSPVPAAHSNSATVNSLLFEDASSLEIGSNTVTVTGGAIQSLPGATSSITGGTLTGATGLVFNTDGAAATQTISSTIASGSVFSLNKQGAGTLILTGNNTYGGTTNVLEGTLDVQNPAALGSSSVDVHAGGTVNVSNGSTLPNALSNENGGVTNFLDTSSAGSSNIANSGSLNFKNSASAGSSTITNDTGALTFTDSSTASSSAIITNNAARTLFTGSATGGSATAVTNAGGTFDISGLTTGGTTVGSIAGEGSYVLGGNSLTTGSNNANTTVSGTISGPGGGLIKVGSGTLTLSGSNSYTGGTTITSGTLSISNDNNLGDPSGGLALNGGTLLTTTGITSARPITLNAGGGTINNSGHTDTFSGVIGSSGVLTSAGSGTLVLSGNNNYAGGFAVASGILEIAGTSGDVTGSISDSGTLYFSRRGNYSATGVISGNGSLTKGGAGNLTLTGANTYLGTTRVNAGGLYVNGSLPSNSTVIAQAGTKLGGSGSIGGITLNGATLDQAALRQHQAR
jgi:autotransporter-associated beta strand protein